MNQRYLLDWLYNNGPATRPQLARDSGLSQPTVFATLANLEQAGLVRPSGQSDEQAGRPALVFEADPTAGAVLAVSADRDGLSIVVADLLGNRLSRRDSRGVGGSVREMVDDVALVAGEAVREAGLGMGDVTCAIVAAPGVYRMHSGGVGFTAKLPGWQSPRLAESLTERLGVPLIVENDVNLAALGEHTAGAGRGTSPFAYLKVGAGIGLGVVIEGELFRGVSGAAGEIGFLPLVDRDPAASDDPDRGPLEAALSGDALVRDARDAGGGDALTPERVHLDARDGVPYAVVAVRRQVDLLAKVVASIAGFIDPEVIVLGGDVRDRYGLFDAELRERVEELSPLRPALAAGILGDDATLHGAVVRGVAMARETVFERRIARSGGTNRAV
ncbi:ROK family transcriptional regulator [Microbacterium tumbae]